MYWCDSSGKPYIANAGMDGKNITLFITKRLKSPKSLTIDYPNNRLYWLDTHLAIIESIQLDGTNRRVSYTFLVILSCYTFLVTKTYKIRELYERKN